MFCGSYNNKGSDSRVKGLTLGTNHSQHRTGGRQQLTTPNSIQEL